MRNRLWAAVLVALTLAGSAQAQVIAMRFGQGGVPFALGAGAFTGTRGGTVAVQVFLTDSDTAFRTEGGVGAVGVGMHSSNTAIAQVLTVTDLVVGPFPQGQVKHVDDSAFGGTTGNPNNPGNASIGAANISGVAPTMQSTPPTVATPDYVLVGTFTFTIPAAAPSGTTQLTLFDWQPAPTSTNNRTVSGSSLDARPEMFVDTATITVNPVPEPGTLALGGLAAVGLAAIRRRRKTASAVTAA